MRILFLSRWYPFPPNNGSKLRIYNLLRGLSTKHEISLLSFVDQSDSEQDAHEIRSICQDVKVVKYKPYRPNSLQAYLGYFSSTPRSVVDNYSEDMQKHIKREIESGVYDLVIASQLPMARYCQGLHRTPVLLEEVEVGVLFDQFTQAASTWRRFRYGLTWYKFRRYLANLLRSSAACTVVSDTEKRLVTQNIRCKLPIEVIPNCISLSDYQGIAIGPQPNTLIYTGSFRYSANYEAMIWFVSEILPLIQAEIADVKLVITGDHAYLPLPITNGVTLTGFVEDIRPFIAHSAVSIAPIRVGGGTRLKILEAMALRTPVVSTAKGAEGLNVTDDRDILIADSPDEYANAVCRLLREPALRNKLIENAYQLVAEKYNWIVVLPQFLDLIERIADKRKSYERESYPI
jgi:polysaccharide biosynthesis protein PslH